MVPLRARVSRFALCPAYPPVLKAISGGSTVLIDLNPENHNSV